MNETFGIALRRYRRAAGVTQRDLAKLIEKDFSYISKLENDRLPPPSADTIVAICNVLKIDSDELLAITGKLPSDIKGSISTSEAAQRFLREAQQLSLEEEEWGVMLNSLRSLRGK